MKYEIEKIISNFDCGGGLAGQTPIDSGHINDTFLVRTDAGASFVLQRINHAVFKDPEGVVANKVLVSDHLRAKLAHLPEDEIKRHVLTFVKTAGGRHFHKDEAGNYWNMMEYINNSHVYLKTKNARVAFEAGKAFGGFLAQTADLDPSRLVETLPKFHSMSHRFRQFDESLTTAKRIRVEKAAKHIEIVRELRPEMHELERLVEAGELPIRVTHNDTKISNALFSDDDEALCVIDLDTVMRGVVHFDFGDAVRTICSGADEDEPESADIDFNLEYFESFAKGFVGQSGIRLTDAEVRALPMSARVMTFIVGLRFLTDYLNNDIYFDTKYDSHNLVRARNQFRLASLINENIGRIEEIVEREYRNSNPKAVSQN